jgi:hypothetical protein
MNRSPLFLSFFLFLALCVPCWGIAQDLTGIWRGHFRSNEGLERLMAGDDRYKIEVQIAQTRGIFQAVTYSYKSTEFYGKAAAEGTINSRTKKVLLRELKILEVRMAGGDVCVMTCFLQYSKLGDDEFLQGTYTSVGTRDSLSGCGKGSIFLHKVATSDFHKEAFLEQKEEELLAEKKKKKAAEKSVAHRAGPKKPAASRKETALKPAPKKKEPASHNLAKSRKPNASAAPSRPVPEKKSVTLIPQNLQLRSDSSLVIEHKPLPAIVPWVIANRSNELIKSITVNNAEVYLNIYDDGAIDNDTVSVYYDNRLVISKARISDQPLKLTLKVEPSSHPHELVMVAENLGDIPPNTSLMVVRDGDKKYEVRIVSTEQKNALISFQYRKIE